MIIDCPGRDGLHNKVRTNFDIDRGETAANPSWRKRPNKLPKPGHMAWANVAKTSLDTTFTLVEISHGRLFHTVPL